MSALNREETEVIAQQLFSRLRSRFGLGMREYLAAVRAIRGGFGGDQRSELKLTLQLLWCHSLDHHAQFELIWDEVAAAQPTPIKQEKRLEEAESQSQKSSKIKPQSEKPVLSQEVATQRSEARSLQPLAVQPPLLSTSTDNLPILQTDWPISRRAMAYAWRYLRRPRPEGPADILDIAATVEQVARSGFFLAPVYRRREVNYAHLLLLIDQGGSMEPFHRFGRDLVETAKQSSMLTQIDVCYFHNVPTTHVYRDSHLTQPVKLAALQSLCDSETSVLIFSDAGAARGFQRMERVRATTQLLAQLQQYTALIGWLNPMPAERWEQSSAQMIAYLTAMETINKDGFSNLIEIVRGQPLSSV